VHRSPADRGFLATDANVQSTTALGVQLSAIKSAPTAWTWHYDTQSAGIRADVSYDIWFGKAQTGSPATSASSYEMSVICLCKRAMR
jgi:xyloglucan-specific endo-beta-1,4-glucanase